MHGSQHYEVAAVAIVSIQIPGRAASRTAVMTVDVDSRYRVAKVKPLWHKLLALCVFAHGYCCYCRSRKSINK